MWCALEDCNYNNRPESTCVILVIKPKLARRWHTPAGEPGPVAATRAHAPPRQRRSRVPSALGRRWLIHLGLHAGTQVAVGAGTDGSSDAITGRTSTAASSSGRASSPGLLTSQWRQAVGKKQSEHKSKTTARLVESAGRRPPHGPDAATPVEAAEDGGRI